jgi:hypothetical protein
MKARSLASIVAVAAGLVAAAPASAAPAPIVAGGSFVRTAPFIDGYIMFWECHAAAPGAVSTTIGSCALKAGVSSYEAGPVTQSGPAATTSGSVVRSAPSFQVCWTASATYGDGSTQNTSGCSSSGAIAGAG